jgi:hypothetical protein
MARKQAEARKRAQAGQVPGALAGQPERRPQPAQQVEEDEEEDEDWTAEEWPDEVRAPEAPYTAPRGEDRVTARPEPERRDDPVRSMPRDQRTEPRDRVPPGPVKAKAEKTAGQAQEQGKDKGQKAAETARDFLTQIAKDLGLELPPTTPGKPAPKPPAPKPAPASPPPRPSYHVPSPDEARIRATEAARAKTTQRIGEIQPYDAPAGERVAGIKASELASPEALQKAFILKTILDKPLARRPRTRGPLADR